MQELTSSHLSAGAELIEDRQCSSCHTSDGTEGLGPTFKGLYGSHRTMADGTQVTVDEKYMIDSIRNPDKQIVKGYDPGSMPPPEVPLTDQEINEIISYIKSLK